MASYTPEASRPSVVGVGRSITMIRSLRAKGPDQVIGHFAPVEKGSGHP